MADSEFCQEPKIFLSAVILRRLSLSFTTHRQVYFVSSLGWTITLPFAKSMSFRVCRNIGFCENCVLFGVLLFGGFWAISKVLAEKGARKRASFRRKCARFAHVGRTALRTGVSVPTVRRPLADTKVASEKTAQPTATTGK